jgi:hypothetical protein
LPDIYVTLNYTPQGLKVDPPVATVAKGQSVSFQLGERPLGGNAVIRITFREPEFFSAGQFQTGDADIVLVGDLPSRSAYGCELLVDGVVWQSSGASDGAHFDPERGN